MRVLVIGDDVSSALGRHQVCWPIERISAGRANKFGRASWAALRPTDTMTEKTVMLSENGRTVRGADSPRDVNLPYITVHIGKCVVRQVYSVLSSLSKVVITHLSFDFPIYLVPFAWILANF